MSNEGRWSRPYPFMVQRGVNCRLLTDPLYQAESFDSYFSKFIFLDHEWVTSFVRSVKLWLYDHVIFFFCDYGVLHWFILKHWTNPSLRYRIPFTFCPVIFANILSRDVFCISTHKEHLSMNFSPCLYSFVSICHNCNASLINCRAVPYTGVDHVDS